MSLDLAVAVLPVAAGGAVLGELLTAIVFLFLVLVALAVSYWAMSAARRAAGSLPVVGGAVVSAIDGLRTQIVGLMRWQEAAAIGKLHEVTQGFVHIIALAMRGQLAAINAFNSFAAHAIDVQYHAILDLQSVTQVALPARIEVLERTVERIEKGTLPVMADQINGIAQVANQAATDIMHIRVDEIAIMKLQISGIAQVANQASKHLAPFLPLLIVLQGLEAWERGATGGFDNVSRDLKAIKKMLEEQGATLAKLSSLLGLAGLSAVALAELGELARDPCRCLHMGPFNDLEDRIEALENAGH